MQEIQESCNKLSLLQTKSNPSMSTRQKVGACHMWTKIIRGSDGADPKAGRYHLKNKAGSFALDLAV
jgi:hypothetical protein